METAAATVLIIVLSWQLGRMNRRIVRVLTGRNAAPVFWVTLIACTVANHHMWNRFAYSATAFSTACIVMTMVVTAVNALLMHTIYRRESPNANRQ